MAWRTLPRAFRIGVWSLAGLVGLVILGGVVVALSFDPDHYKPQVIAAVKQATGTMVEANIHRQLPENER